ncbi:MAG: ATPase [Alphaproteobacteria bacterium]|nr:ATPase [Alphaproteobacteria bacterium]
MRPFIGRHLELEKLNSLSQKATASLVVIRGRRRIGKSRLIEEYAKDKKTFKFIGLPPTESPKDQKDEFAWQLENQIKKPVIKKEDWNDLFLELSKHTKTGRVVVIFDEISWMGDDLFLGKLKTAWDEWFSKNPRLTFILCGSVSSWIDENILSSTGFVGRISLVLTLRELSLRESSIFLGNMSSYEKFKILSVTGGIPRYLEEIDPGKSADKNIMDLCYNPSGLLYYEFEQIFSDLFSPKNKTYRMLLESIVDGSLSPQEIFERLDLNKAGYFSDCLSDLEVAGFIERDYTWHLRSGRRSKLSHYRLIDNYARFYLKYIFPYKDQIKKGVLPSINWEAIMGLQFENLVLNNRNLLIERLGIKEIIYENPYFQKASDRRIGCQIDYLVQTRFNILYLFEVKFSRRPIGVEIIESIEQKIKALALPMSVKPILVHVNGVTEDLEDRRYFANIISFGEFFA